MSNLIGKYVVDIPNSAKLRAGWFTDRFTMKPGYLEEVEALFQANAEAICDVTLFLDNHSLTLISEDGEETFRVIALPSTTPGKMVVDWQGDNIAFDVVALDDDIIHFQSDINELAAWAWRKNHA